MNEIVEQEHGIPRMSKLELQVALGDRLLRRVSEAFESGDTETFKNASAIYDETAVQICKERSREHYALECGLPADATWSDISNASSERSRKQRAAELGLPQNATWGDIVSSLGSV